MEPRCTLYLPPVAVHDVPAHMNGERTKQELHLGIPNIRFSRFSASYLMKAHPALQRFPTRGALLVQPRVPIRYSESTAPMEPQFRAMLTSGKKAFENTSTSVAASQMRNALNNLADTVSDPEQKKLFETEMDNFFALFRRYLNDKAKGNTL